MTEGSFALAEKVVVNYIAVEIKNLGRIKFLTVLGNTCTSDIKSINF